MGSSTKKKREKKADFQKQKLKVGKARPKAQNSTSTDFKAKAIVLNQQLSSEAPEYTTQVQHYISLLGSKNESQRKESLSWLTTALLQHQNQRQDIQVSSTVLLEKSVPLLLDASLSVRSQLEKFVKAVSSQDLADHAASILPYIRAALTHLSTQIRSTGLEVLSHLLSRAQVAAELVACPGGWTKTLDCTATLLGWRDISTAKSWSLAKANFRADARSVARVLQVLEQLLQAGLGQMESGENEHGNLSTLHDALYYKLPDRSDPYAYLHLFGQPSDLDEVSLEDTDERQRVFQDRFEPAFEFGLEGARKEGGEVGRIAGSLTKFLTSLAKKNG